MEKYKDIFDTSHLSLEIKKRSLRSGAVTLASQAIMFVIQLGSTVILARILSPEDYGINAMAISITGLAGTFSNLGLSSVTVQRSNVNHAQVSTLFWINALIGLLLTLFIAAISPVVAWFYKAPEMLWVILSLSITFTISGISVQHSALLTRQMRFYSLAKIQVLSMLIGILVAILAGYNGLGYWALVLNSITSVTVNALGRWLSCPWVPGMPKLNTDLREMIKFGSDLTGFNIINYFARNLDNILIGRYHGSSALGIYSKAYQLLMMPITNLRDPMTRVAMPALSRLQSEPRQYREYYLKCVSLLAFISMPLVAFLFVSSDQVIRLLLGPQWLGASEIFKILAVAAFLQPVSGTAGMVLISMGRSKVYLTLGLINSFVICSSFVVGLSWGVKGVAIAYAIANYLMLLPTLYYSFKNTSVSIKDFITAIYKPVFSSIALGIVCNLIIQSASYNGLIGLISICLFVGSAVYFMTFVMFSGGLDNLKQYISYLFLVLERK